MDELEVGGHTARLIATYERRHQLLEVQQARFGFQTDPGVIMELDEIQAKLIALRAQHERANMPTIMLRDLVRELQSPPRARGLLVLVGAGRAGKDPMSQAAGAAIQYHLETTPGLQHCWLIPSGMNLADGAAADPRQQEAIVVARKLEQYCAAHGVSAQIWPIADAFRVQDTYDLIQRLLADEVPAAGLAAQEIICDFTGGTKLMSAGMILACGARWPMQYMAYGTDGRSVPMQIQFAAKEPL